MSILGIEPRTSWLWDMGVRGNDRYASVAVLVILQVCMSYKYRLTASLREVEAANQVFISVFFVCLLKYPGQTSRACFLSPKGRLLSKVIQLAFYNASVVRSSVLRWTAMSKQNPPG